MSRGLLSDDWSDVWWVYVVIPVTSAFVGYITNVLAIQMAFWPLHFVGIKLWQPKGSPFGFIGWQGIVPCKATKMASILVDIMVARLLDVKEIFGRIDPWEVTKLCELGMKKACKKIVDELLQKEMPEVWETLPFEVKSTIYKSISKDSSQYVRLMLNLIRERALEIVDVKHMVVKEVESNKMLIVQIFKQVGKKEFGILRRSGIYFGFLFGLIQALVYYFYKEWWVLPVFGFFVGWITNFIAIKLIFEPAKPVSLGCFKIQGAFLKRQQEASAKISELCEDYFLKQKIIWEEIMNGAYKNQFDALLAEATKQYVEQQTSMASQLAINMIFGYQYYQQILQKVVCLLENELPTVVPSAYDYMEQAMSIRWDMQKKLEALPPEDFINFLRPAFREDEWKLILVGGILGAAMGFLQQFAIFSNI